VRGRERARGLGEAHVKKGENAVAAEFFSLAGDSARAAAIREEARVGDDRPLKSFENRVCSRPCCTD
jgi:hypothetical protein